jgi:hypothetical protein
MFRNLATFCSTLIFGAGTAAASTNSDAKNFSLYREQSAQMINDISSSIGEAHGLKRGKYTIARQQCDPTIPGGCPGSPTPPPEVKSRSPDYKIKGPALITTTKPSSNRERK